MNILHSIGTVIHSVGSAADNAFHSIFSVSSKAEHDILVFLKPVVESESGKIIADLLPKALEVVAGIASGNPVLVGVAARDAAVSELGKQLASEGKSAALYIMHFAVESALAHFRAAPPAVAPRAM